MKPLDLSARAPRSPRVELNALPVLARTIDRARAGLPGGNLGQYDPVGRGGLSNMMFEGLGIAPVDFNAAVATAETERDVITWVENHSDVATWPAVGQKLRDMRLADIPPDRLAHIKAHYPAHVVEHSETSFDLLDGDDRASFGPAVAPA